MAGPVESYSSSWLSNLAYSNPWRTGQDYARRFLDAFPKTSTLPISTMPPYARRSRRRRVVRRRAMRLRRGVGRRVRRVRRRMAKKPAIVRKIRRANRGFKRAMQMAKRNMDIKYIYEIKKVDGISMTYDTAVGPPLPTQFPNIVYNSVRVSDFPLTNSLLNENTTRYATYGYTEYRVHKAFVKITPRNYNWAKNSTTFSIAPGQHPWIAAWPLSHFGTAPTLANIPTQNEVCQSTGVKRISFYKSKATHLPMAALMEQKITVVDGGATDEIINVPLKNMPYVQYKNTALENPALMPTALWVPQAANADSKLAFDVEYHVIFALKNERGNVTEL